MHFEICRQATGLIDSTANDGGDWRWGLMASNNQILADSGEGHHNKKNCMDAIDLVKGTNQATSVNEI